MTPSEDPIERPDVRPLRLRPAVVVAVFAGGFLGTMARYLLDSAHPTSTGHFPFTTLVINLSGSLAIGCLVPVAERLRATSPLVRPFAIVGVLGGWTTYSTLAVDTDLLTKDSHVGLALAYIAATVFLGIALVALGDALARAVAPPTEAP